MWSDRNGRSTAPSRRGFTLIEVMVALIVAIAMSTALVRYFTGVRSEAVRLREELDTWAVARSVLDTIPSGAVLAAGTTVGAAGAYAWRLEATPMAQMLAPPQALAPAGGAAEDLVADDGATPPPVPMRLSVVVTGPRGGTARLETVRLAHGGAANEP